MSEDNMTEIRLECLRLAVDVGDGLDIDDVVKVAETFLAFVAGATMSSKQ